MKAYIVRKYYTSLIVEMEKDMNDLHKKGYTYWDTLVFDNIQNDSGGCLFIVTYIHTQTMKETLK